MKIVLSIIGWAAWVFCAYMALTVAYNCRRLVRNGQSFQWATAIQSFFFWIIAIVFIFAPLNKLHILWLLPICFFGTGYLVLVGVPILSPVILFFTQIFMILVLFGAGASAQRSALFWESLLEGMDKDDEDVKEFKQGVASCLIPDKISPDKFRANNLLLSTRGIPQLLDRNEQLSPTPSLKRFYLISDRPMGYPQWFIAAYPDVVSWVADNIEQEESILHNIFGNMSDDELLTGKRRTKVKYLRILIDTYLKETGLPLECSE
ncbi:MAG: hypothetical protein Q8O10_03115 [candidate division Zixibacteria bacterium]|nr:hypothetical protein [candidate division Zixibacteria bacterium]